MNSILLIDDDDFTAVFLESILGSNYSIQHAANGRDGLAVALAVPPTLILLDVEMPMMDGYEVCRHLKASGQTSEIPVIFLSAHVEIPDRLAGYEAGGDDYMTKPFDPDELATKIEVVLRNRSRNLCCVSRDLGSQCGLAKHRSNRSRRAAQRRGQSREGVLRQTTFRE